jgi:hypothetical protein
MVGGELVGAFADQIGEGGGEGLVVLAVLHEPAEQGAAELAVEE